MRTEQTDALSFGPFHRGEECAAQRYLGAHFEDRNGQHGAVFRTWAPHAAAVCVMGEWNGWTEPTPMTPADNGGIFECFVPDVRVYDTYKFRIIAADGRVLYKADPFAFHAETRPADASKLYDLSGYIWRDGAWMQHRQPLCSRPVNIYKLHAGSWRRHPDGSLYSYRQIADALADYAADMGYTHVELMPLTEHLHDRSCGYQATGYFAPTSRYGTPHDLMYLTDTLHRRGIGVIFEWAPTRFSEASCGLSTFDGGLCYESAADASAFDCSKCEVQSFLISSALYWLEAYHADGLHIAGTWTGDGSAALCRRLAAAVLSRHPHALMVGDGFGYAPNAGWAEDLLGYMSADPSSRSGICEKLTAPLFCAASESSILPLSHEVGSLISRMPGGYGEKFANARAFLAYMHAHPGKKLLFMGQEFAQFALWDHGQELDWLLLGFEMHRAFHSFVRTLNRLYKDTRPLFDAEDSREGFRWLTIDTSDNSVVAFSRRDRAGNGILCVCNFSSAYHSGYRIGAPSAGRYDVALNTDSKRFGGSSADESLCYIAEDVPFHGFDHFLALELPPLSVQYLRVPRSQSRDQKKFK